MESYRLDLNKYKIETAHLSLLEHGVYLQLKNLYLSQESPLSADTDKIKRLINARTQDEKDAVNNILADFFIQTNNQFHNEHLDNLIQSKSKSTSTLSPSIKPVDKPIAVKPASSTSNTTSPEFERFWTAYPDCDKRHGKSNSFMRWTRAKADCQIDLIISHIEYMKKNQWENTKFVPAISKYLLEKRWDGFVESTAIKSNRTHISLEGRKYEGNCPDSPIEKF